MGGQPVAGKVTLTYKSWTPVKHGGGYVIAPPSTRVRAQADVSRQLITTIAKLGGGRVRITVTGTKQRPLKVYILDTFGYALAGVKPKKVDARGRATFNLGNRRGSFSCYVDAGVYGDLFWFAGRPKFRL